MKLVFIILFLFMSSTIFAQSEGKDLFSFSLEELMNIEVRTSSKYAQKLKEAHSDIQVITNEEIISWGFNNLAEALNYLSGFYLTDDRNYSFVGIRGFSRLSDYNNRVLMMIDDHVLNENVYGSILLGNDFGLDITLIDRIEVIRGPGASLYGNNAMVGVINVVTKAKEGSKHQLHVAAGNDGLYKTGYSIQQNEVDRSYYMGMSLLHSSGENFYFEELDDPYYNNGISNGMDEEKAYGLYGSYRIGKVEIKGLGSYRKKLIPTGAWETLLDEESNSIDKRAFLELVYKNRVENRVFLVKSSWDLYEYSGQYAYEAPEPYYYDRSIGSWGNLQVEYRLDFGKKGKLLSGAELHYSPRSDYSEKADDDEVFYKNNSFFNASGFFQYDVSLSERLNFLAGLRVDYYDYTDVSLNPRIGLVYSGDNGYNIRVGFNKAFRAPNFSEMFYEAIDENIGNPDLKHEDIYYFDFDFRKQFSASLYGGLSIFAYTVHDLIDIIETDDELLQYVNNGKVGWHGGSVYTGIRLGQNINARFSYDLAQLGVIDEEVADEVDEQVNFPEHVFKTNVLYRVPDYFTIGTGIYYESGRKTIGGGKTNGNIVVNANLTSKKLFELFYLGFKVNNLFDTEYFHPSRFEHEQDQIIQPHRTVRLSLRFDW